ncbi:MAG: hypothetical protein U5L09_00015 [Bacteroidales bacterium]|nr:hypothetical protein [Bacteroidales bacterium]
MVGTNFILIHAAVGGDMPPEDFGVGGGWGGTRSTSGLVDKFMSDEEYPGYLNENNVGKNEIYVPGDYQPSSGYDTEWDPATAPALIETESDSVYVGYVYIGLQGAEFKFTEERNWDAAWGYDDEEKELSMDGGNMSITFPWNVLFQG